MKIIIDTNAIFQDFLLSQPEITTLEHYLSQTKSELCIPEVVIKEMVRHFRKVYQQDVIYACNNATKRLRILEIKLPLVPDLENAVTQYYDKLLERIRSLSARIMEVPPVELKVLLDRCINEKKPFKSSGVGLKDAIIWETILEECRQHKEDIVFITNNLSDFEQSQADKNKHLLHPELADDLKGIEYPLDHFTLCKTIQEFNEKYAKTEPIEITDVTGIDTLALLRAEESNIFLTLQDRLPQFFNLRHSNMVGISIVREFENVRAVNALRIGGDDLEVTVRASVIVDTEFHSVDLDEVTYLQEKADFIMVGPRWDAKGYYEITFRFQFLIDIKFIWNTKSTKPTAMSVIKIGFREEDM